MMTSLTLLQKIEYLDRIQKDLNRISCSNFEFKLNRLIPSIKIRYNWWDKDYITGTIILSEDDLYHIRAKDLTQMIHEHCIGMLIHEFDEQFKVDGKIVFNPHPQIEE